MTNARGWTCTRTTNRVRCRHHNPPRTRKCQACGKPRPAKREPKHMAALDLTYEQYVVLNGGEHCGICGAKPDGRRLDRDHEHKADGVPRGLLCRRDNRLLSRYHTAEWLRAALVYLERAEGRMRENGVDTTTAD